MKALPVIFFLLLLTACTVEQDVVHEEQEYVAPVISERSNLTTAPFLWRINTEPPSYIFGTIHSSDPRVLTIPDVVYNAILETDATYTEVELDYLSMQALGKRFILGENKTLREYVPPDFYKTLDTYLANLGVTILWYDETNVSKFLLMLSDMKNPTIKPEDNYLDRRLHDLALLDGDDVGALETQDEHMAPFSAITKEEQIKIINDSITFILTKVKKEDAPYADKIAEEYISGDLDYFLPGNSFIVLEDTEAQKNYDDALIDERNRVQANKIIDVLESEPDRGHFFAAGVGHFSQDSGIPSLLEDAGYTLERVSFEPSETCEQPLVNKNGRCYLEYESEGYLFENKTNAFCESFPDNVTRLKCYFNVAVKEEDKAFCAALSNVWDRDLCMLNVATATQDVRDCAPLKTKYRSTCYYRLALMNDDPELCDRMEHHNGGSAACYSYFAVKEQDVSYCELIKNDGWFTFFEDAYTKYYYDPLYKEERFTEYGLSWMYAARKLKHVCESLNPRLLIFYREFGPDDVVTFTIPQNPTSNTSFSQ